MRSYEGSLHEFRVVLTGLDAAVLRAEEVLSHFGARPGGAALDPVHLEFRVGAPPEVGPERITATHLDLTVGRSGPWLVVRGPHSTSHVVADGSHSCTYLSAAAPVPIHVFTWVLFHQLRQRGAFALHAAAVAFGARGCLVVGPSGVGKSTLTRALVAAGAALVSDDSVLLVRDGGGLAALALRRGVYLDPATAAPGEFRPCVLLEGTKQELLLDPAVPRVARVTPALTLLPERIDGPESSFEPVGAAAVTFAAARESRLGELDREGASAHLQALAMLAATSRGFRARLGRDVLEHPSAVADHIRTLVEAP